MLAKYRDEITFMELSGKTTKVMLQKGLVAQLFLFFGEGGGLKLDALLLMFLLGQDVSTGLDTNMSFLDMQLTT